MSLENQIKDKIKELEQKKWKSQKEEDELRLVNGHLNRDRLVSFGNMRMLDIYDHDRFEMVQRALRWVLQLKSDSDEGI